MTISFVVPVRNDAERLSRCLRTIADNVYIGDRAECVVADNGSTDRSADVARAAGARVLSLPGLRVSALRNRAAATVSSDMLAFVDADHEISPAWIAAAMDVFRDPTIVAAGALCLPPPSGTWTQRMYGVLRGRTVGQGDASWLGSGNMVVRRDVFERLGGFDESLDTCEDVDLCGRMRLAGGRVVADERFVNIHLGDPRTLRDLFLSERWRGRDNLRVSLHTMPGLRDVPSIAIPVVDALALLTGVASLAGLFLAPVAWKAWLAVAGGATAVVAGLAALRAVRMALSGNLRTAGDLIQAYVVALVYDAGRASSLFLPARHRGK